MNGKFIVFSGLDASGKTTNRNHIDLRLNNTNVNYVMTREPGGTPFAEKVRELILSREYEVPALTETLLFYAARIDHTKNFIDPWIERGYHVLTDRYYDSTLAYQTIQCEEVLQVHTACLPKLRKPDLTLMYDIPAEIALERMFRSRGAAVMDKIEMRGLEYFNSVRNNFLSMARDDSSTIIIDATKPLSDVLEESWRLVSTFLGISINES
jgi:dTMP kinase